MDHKKKNSKKSWKKRKPNRRLLERLDDLVSPDDIEIGDDISEEDILEGQDREH